MLSSSTSSDNHEPSFPLSPSMSEIFQDDYNYLEGHVTESKAGITVFSLGVHRFEIMGDHSFKSTVGVLIKPEDIILSPDLVKTSARYMIRMKVVDIRNSSLRNGVLDIYLSIDEIRLRSRITIESKKYLRINEGEYIYAIFKATAPHVIREGQHNSI